MLRCCVDAAAADVSLYRAMHFST